MNCNDLFRFGKNPKTNGCILSEYLQKNNAEITSVDIPAVHNGAPVDAVGDNAFAFAAKLEAVGIPQSITYLGENAFCGCATLKKVVIPDSVMEVGKGTFSDCKSLISVEIDNPVLQIAPKMFSGCERLCAEAIAAGMPMFIDENNVREYIADYSRYDVARLLVGQKRVRMSKIPFIGVIIINNLYRLLPLAEECGLLNEKEFVTMITQFCAKHGQTECTAWLLDYTNRRFGFEKEDKYEL